MAQGEAGFNPIEYHNGTVWPHDSSIVAAGLARYGYREEAAAIIAGIFEARWHSSSDSKLAGYAPRNILSRAIPHGLPPTGMGRSSAYAGIRTLLGLEPKGETSPRRKLYWSWMGMLPGNIWPVGRALLRRRATKSGLSEFQQVLSRRATLGEEKLAA